MRALLLVSLLLASLCQRLCAQTTVGAAPVPGRPAPAFTLPDLNGKQHSLSEFKGRRVTLFFFCGCSWCAEVAKEWARLQRMGVLLDQEKPSKPTEKKAVPPPPKTVIIYFEMDAESARDLFTTAGLDPAQTTALLDEPQDVTIRQYDADPCPRAFVVDDKGILRYTNNHADDTARKASTATIIARTMGALHAAGSRLQPPPTRLIRKNMGLPKRAKNGRRKDKGITAR
jgi:peroxiredoxin